MLRETMLVQPEELGYLKPAVDYDPGASAVNQLNRTELMLFAAWNTIL